MAIHLLSAGAEATRAKLVEQRIRRAIPDVAVIADLKELSGAIKRGSANDPAVVLIIEPTRDMGYFTKVGDSAPGHRCCIFFVRISGDVTSSSYKALIPR